MASSSEAYKSLFDERPALAQPARGDNLAGSGDGRVKVAGLVLDFTLPSAPRRAAAGIVELPDVAARRAALAQVPEAFREMVRIMVERAFYNAGRV